jgi:hypothetical protein
MLHQILLRRIKWTGHAACMGEMRNAYNILVGKSEGKRPLGRLGIDGKIILEWILGIYGEWVWTGFTWLRIWTSGGPL